MTLTDELIKKDRMGELNNILRGMMYICVSFIPHINLVLKASLFFIGIILIGFYGFSLVCRHKYGYGCDYFKESTEDIEKTHKEFTQKVVGESTRKSYTNKLLVKDRNEKIGQIISSTILIVLFSVLFEREWYMILVILAAARTIGDNLFALITNHKYEEIHRYNLIKEALKNEIKNDELEMRIRGEAAQITLTMIPYIIVVMGVLSYFFGKKMLILGMVVLCFVNIIQCVVKRILLKKYS